MVFDGNIVSVNTALARRLQSLEIRVWYPLAVVGKANQRSAYSAIALTKALLNDECTIGFLRGSVSFSSCLIVVLTIVYSYGVLKASVPTPSADMLTP